MKLDPRQHAMLDGQSGDAVAMAMRILCAMGEVCRAERLVPVQSAHVDGCLYHGPSGVAFAERLLALGGRVRVPTSLNVGAMDLLHPEKVRLKDPDRSLAVRLMNAYVAMGCTPTWTCAPYQAGFRPAFGTHVAWAESNAIVFANSVLGARTDRYGDFMDICCALTGFAPESGLHRDENRRATLHVVLENIPEAALQLDAFYPVLGAWLGRVAGSDVAVIEGLPPHLGEDRLKALGAAAASTGAVGLFHAVGLTPEAASLESACGHRRPARREVFDRVRLRTERDRLSTNSGTRLDAVAVGSPHFSLAEFADLLRLLEGRRVAVPFHACTGRHVFRELESRGWDSELHACGVELLTDTCVVVTPVLRSTTGVLMTNSGKFAHYSRPLVQHEVVFGSLSDCVESAVAGRVERDEAAWGLP